MKIGEGKTYYFYDDRAVDNVCRAHVLHVLPHPEREEDRLIVYRWYGKHRKRWWYGVTTISQQEIWADYCKDAVRIAKERAKKRKEKRADNEKRDMQEVLLAHGMAAGRGVVHAAQQAREGNRHLQDAAGENRTQQPKHPKTIKELQKTRSHDKICV